MNFNYNKDFYIKQDLATLLKVLMHVIKQDNNEAVMQIRQAIEEKLMQGLSEEESKETENLLYHLCRKCVLLSKKLNEEVA
jgi:hypothetical protein